MQIRAEERMSGADGVIELNAVPLTADPVRTGQPPWLRVFPGEARELAAVRRWLANLLPGVPVLDDIASVATELGSNAIRHTASGRGGSFAVELTRQTRMIRVAVADSGGPGEPVLVNDPDGEQGRGLLLVRGLAIRIGVQGDQHGRLVWAELCPEPDDSATTGTDPEPDRGAERGGPGERALRRLQAGGII
jgi:serine/threonine-protein kinase RsbW